MEWLLSYEIAPRTASQEAAGGTPRKCAGRPSEHGGCNAAGVALRQLREAPDWVVDPPFPIGAGGTRLSSEDRARLRIMAFWFLNDLARLATERQALGSLEAESDWLVGSHWRLAKGLHLDVTIRVGEQDFDITLEYPNHFPFAPPIARPTNETEERWSTHQYPGGTLCLEWGPDNWHGDLIGADMLRSAHRLLTTERPDSHERTVVAPSRHFLTAGQELRGQYGRFCTTASLRAYCAEMLPGT